MKVFLYFNYFPFSSQERKTTLLIKFFFKVQIFYFECSTEAELICVHVVHNELTAYSGENRSTSVSVLQPPSHPSTQMKRAGITGRDQNKR